MVRLAFWSDYGGRGGWDLMWVGGFGGGKALDLWVWGWVELFLGVVIVKSWVMDLGVAGAETQGQAWQATS